MRRVLEMKEKRLVCLQAVSGRWVPLLAQGTVRIDHSEEGKALESSRYISLDF